MPASKSKFLVPAIGAAVVIGGAAAYMVLKGGPVDPSSPVASAKVVPDEALMATYITSDSAAWSKLQQFGTPETQKMMEQGLKEFQASLLGSSGLDYQRDLKPWVGNVMIAMLPDAAAAQPADALLVVEIKDKVKALAFANQVKQQKGIKTQESDYKGVKISETQQEKQTTKTYSAVLNNHVVLSSNRKAVEQAIDTSKGQPSFASKAGANQILTKGIDLENPIAQIYMPNYGESIKQLIANSPNAAQLPPETLKQLEQVESLIVGVGVDDAGVRLKATGKVKPQKAYAQYKPVPGKVVAQFPAETIALVSGQGIKSTWSAMVEQSKADPQTQQLVNLVRQRFQLVNLDADKEVFGWMDGEFALGGIASNQGILSSVGFGGALVIDTSDRKTAETTLGKLDNMAKINQIAVAQRKVQGNTVTEWKLPQQQVLLGHGWLDQDSMFIAIGGPLVDVMVAPNKQPLDNSQAFKTATQSLPKPNAGYFYLDMDKTMAVLNNGLLKAQASTMPPETMSMLNSIRGVGITVTQPNDTTGQIEMLLALKSKNVSLNK